MAVNEPSASMQPPEQLRYARWLEWSTRVGMTVLLLAFAAYVFGLAESHVPVSRLPELWVHPVGRFLELSESPAGWGWVALLHRGDIAGLLGIAILAGTSAWCLLALLPIYLARGEHAFAAVCLAEVAVIVLAASGLAAAH